MKNIKSLNLSIKVDLLRLWRGTLDGNIIISYFGGNNNIFADCRWQWHITTYLNPP